MLAGASVAYGNARFCDYHITGYASEVTMVDGHLKPYEKPLIASSIFDLASLTKLFTCISILMLLEDRIIRMSDCIGVLDERFAHLNDVSLLDVLSYRAVLRSPERIDAQATKAKAEVQVFSTYRSHRNPTKLYSDMNALVLKYAIEAVTGITFWSFLQQHILGPIGMTNTFARVPENRLDDCVCYNYEHRIVDGQYLLNKIVTPGTPHDPKARLLCVDEENVSGHAGLMSTLGDMINLAQALLAGRLFSRETLRLIGINRTGSLKVSGDYVQYMGLLCFSRSAVPRLSEVPKWMGRRAFALSGYTGNHIAIDPDLGVFDLLLGNRCHNRLSLVQPAEAAGHQLNHDGSGRVAWPDGRMVYSSWKYVYLKDRFIHNPIYDILYARGWITR